MNVNHSESSYPPVAVFVDYIGGVYVYTIRLARALRLQGHDVHIISYHTESEADEAKLAELKKETSFIHLIPKDRSAMADMRNIAQAFDETGCHFIVPNFRTVAYAACAQLSRHKNIRTVAVCHNDHSSYYDLFKRFKSIIDVFVSPVESTFKRLKAIFPDRQSDIFKIGHGIPKSDCCDDFSGGELRISYHGKTSENQKKIFRLPELSLRIKKRGVSHKFQIIGEGEEYNDLISEIKKHDLNEHFTVQPFISSNEKMMESVRTCHVEILTSEFEGFCLSLAESMGAGMPGVAMECGGVIEEYLHDGENGFVVPQGDLDAMADKIVLLQSNPDLWKKLSIAARKQIHDNYNLELFGKRYSELFCTLNNSDKTFRRWSAIRPVFVSNESVCSRIVEKCGKTLKIWE